MTANQEIKGPASGAVYLEGACRDGEALVQHGIQLQSLGGGLLKYTSVSRPMRGSALTGAAAHVDDHVGAQRGALEVDKKRGIKGTSGRLIQPWHFSGSAVCHDNAGCEDGRDPQRGERLPGTGGKPLCGTCARLDDRAK